MKLVSVLVVATSLGAATAATSNNNFRGSGKSNYSRQLSDYDTTSTTDQSYSLSAGQVLMYLLANIVMMPMDLTGHGCNNKSSKKKSGSSSGGHSSWGSGSGGSSWSDGASDWNNGGGRSLWNDDHSSWNGGDSSWSGSGGWSGSHSSSSGGSSSKKKPSPPKPPKHPRCEAPHAKPIHPPKPKKKSSSSSHSSGGHSWSSGGWSDDGWNGGDWSGGDSWESTSNSEYYDNSKESYAFVGASLLASAAIGAAGYGAKKKCKGGMFPSQHEKPAVDASSLANSDSMDNETVASSVYESSPSSYVEMTDPSTQLRISIPPPPPPARSSRFGKLSEKIGSVRNLMKV
jgi:hypothetical protein